MTKLDHIIFGCTDLNEGQTILAAQLGIPPAARGKHDMMGTHNALWNMGDAYIELVAIDPDAPDPGRPRWFGLSDPAMQACFVDGPKLINWAVSVDDIAPVSAKSPVTLGPVEAFARNDLRWNVAVPEGGGPGLNGAFPLTINWTEGMHPAERLPDVGLRCEDLAIVHPQAREIIDALGPIDGPVTITEGPMSLTCRIRRENGETLSF